MPSSGSTFKATLVGGTAVLLWATLALLTSLSGATPPFQLTAMAFSIAGRTSSFLVARMPTAP